MMHLSSITFSCSSLWNTQGRILFSSFPSEGLSGTKILLFNSGSMVNHESLSSALMKEISDKKIKWFFILDTMAHWHRWKQLKRGLTNSDWMDFGINWWFSLRSNDLRCPLSRAESTPWQLLTMFHETWDTQTCFYKYYKDSSCYSMYACPCSGFTSNHNVLWQLTGAQGVTTFVCHVNI